MVERVQAFLLAREECLVGVQGHGAKEKKKRIKEEAALREAVAQAEEDALRRRERMRERKPRHEKKKRMAPILPENTQWEVSADSVLDPVVWWEDIAIVDDGGADDSPGERACQLPYNASQVDAGLESLGLLAVRVDVGLQRDDLFRSRKKEKTQERQARRAQVRNEELRSRAAMYLAGHGRNNTTPARAKSEAPAQRWGWDAMMDGLTETGGVRPSAGLWTTGTARSITTSMTKPPRTDSTRTTSVMHICGKRRNAKGTPLRSTSLLRVRAQERAAGDVAIDAEDSNQPSWSKGSGKRRRRAPCPCRSKISCAGTRRSSIQAHLSDA